MIIYKGIATILIWSEDYKKLADWYQEKFGFETIEEIQHPNDTGIGLSVGGFYLWIGKHSEVKGKSKDPYRIMFNFTVDSVTEAYQDLKSKNVEFIAKPFKAFTFDRYFATFKDLDGNIVQLIGGE